MIYKDAPIRLLDDALSAVDTKTERQIVVNLRESAPPGNAGSRSTIIISHRLSAVEHADEILVLKEGRIAERGSHGLLTALGGIYAGQWLMQSGAPEPATSTGGEPAPFPAGGPDRPGSEWQPPATGMTEDAA